MSVASEVPDFENEPTAFLQELDDVCMSLPVADSPHAMVRHKCINVASTSYWPGVGDSCVWTEKHTSEIRVAGCRKFTCVDG